MFIYEASNPTAVLGGHILPDLLGGQYDECQYLHNDKRLSSFLSASTPRENERRMTIQRNNCSRGLTTLFQVLVILYPIIDRGDAESESIKVTDEVPLPKGF